MARRDPSQTDASGLEPTEQRNTRHDHEETQDALTRVHGGSSSSTRSRAVSRSQQSSARHEISSGSTRTALSAQSSSSTGHIAAGSRRLPAAQFLSQSAPAAPHSKRMTLILILGIAGPILVIVSLIWLLRPDELSVRAGKALEDGNRQMVLVRDAIAARRATEAMRAIEAGRKIIDVPTPADAGLNEKIKALNAQFQLFLVEAQRIERDLKVQQNIDSLHTRFTHMGELDNAGLDLLERQGLAFIANPVSPGGEADPVAIESYKTQVDDIRRTLDSIKVAKQRLDAARISVQETKARSEVAELVRRERFQEALDRIADYRQKFPAGRFDDHQAFVDNAAKRTWDAVKVYAESRIQDARTPGMPAAKRKLVVDQARKRLDEVIANFGIAEQVETAKALLQQLPGQ